MSNKTGETVNQTTNASVEIGDRDGKWLRAVAISRPTWGKVGGEFERAHIEGTVLRNGRRHNFTFHLTKPELRELVEFFCSEDVRWV